MKYQSNKHLANQQGPLHKLKTSKSNHNQVEVPCALCFGAKKVIYSRIASNDVVNIAIHYTFNQQTAWVQSLPSIRISPTFELPEGWYGRRQHLTKCQQQVSNQNAIQICAALLNWDCNFHQWSQDSLTSYFIPGNFSGNMMCNCSAATWSAFFGTETIYHT